VPLSGVRTYSMRASACQDSAYGDPRNHLVAVEREGRRLWALHNPALHERLSPLVPAGVLAQAWRDGPQANL